MDEHDGDKDKSAKENVKVKKIVPIFFFNQFKFR